MKFVVNLCLLVFSFSAYPQPCLASIDVAEEHETADVLRAAKRSSRKPQAEDLKGEKPWTISKKAGHAIGENPDVIYQLIQDNLVNLSSVMVGGSTTHFGYLLCSEEQKMIVKPIVTGLTLTIGCSGLLWMNFKKHPALSILTFASFGGAAVGIYPQLPPIPKLPKSFIEGFVTGMLKYYTDQKRS